MRSEEEEYTVWERRYRGICRTGEYFVGRPATRTVQKEYRETVYELEPQHIKVCFFTKLVKIFRPSSEPLEYWKILKFGTSSLQTVAVRFGMLHCSMRYV